MKKNYGFISFSLITLFLFASLAGCAAKPEEKAPQPPASPATPSVKAEFYDPYEGMSLDEKMKAMGLEIGMQDHSVNTIYKWGPTKFADLPEEATQIVVARATDFYKTSDVTQTAELQVLKTIEGKPHDSVVLYMMEGEVDIQIGETYILFLDSQRNGVDNGYYSLAGSMGVMHLSNTAKQLTAFDQKLVDIDLVNWLAKNISADPALGSIDCSAYSLKYAEAWSFKAP